MTRTAKDIIADAYDAYNARETDRLLSMVTDDVNWPDGDKRLHGREALRSYWGNQWTRTSTHDTPTLYVDEPDGRIKVCLDQVVQDLQGNEISRGSFEYFFTMRDDLIARLDIGR